MNEKSNELAPAQGVSASPDAAPRRVTMQDVADRAGVHQTTVSIALRDHPSIPTRTRDRILAVARELGYRKDPQLDAFNRYRLVRQGRAEKIAFVAGARGVGGEARRVAQQAYFQGAAEEAERLGWRVEWVAFGRASYGETIGQLSESGFTSAVLAKMPSVDEALLKWRELPAVAIDRFDLESEVDVFAPDYRKAAREAVSALFRRGYRRIGYYAAFGFEQRIDDLCQVGYLVEARLRQLPVLTNTRSAFGSGKDRVLDWIRGDDLDALITLDGQLCQALAESRAALGRELELFALDWMDQLGPNVSGIDLRRRAVGRAAIARLAEMRLGAGQGQHGVAATTTYLPVEPVLSEEATAIGRSRRTA